MISFAPASTAPWITLTPTPPAPNTAIELSELTSAAFITDPTPVITEHPISAASSKGISFGILSTAPSGITVKFENDDTPAKWKISFSLKRNLLCPSLILPDDLISLPTGQSAGRLFLHSSHSPHDKRHKGIT